MIYEVLQSIGFNWHVAVLNFINFLVILVLLNKFFFKKIGHTINERDAKIKSGLENAKRAEDNLANANKKGEAIIESSEIKASAILQDAANKGESLARDIKLKAEHEAESMREKLKRAIEESDDKAYRELANRAPELLSSIYKEILGNNIDKSIDEKFILATLKAK